MSAVDKSGNEIYKSEAGFGAISLSLLGIILACDQLLLPMFHISGSPFKVSYVILAAWFIHWVNLPGRHTRDVRDEEIRRFATIILGILLCAYCGELLLSASQNVLNHRETLRSTMIYVFVIFAFGLGRSQSRFSFSWIVPLLITAVVLNLAFIFTRAYIPPVLVDIYYPETYVRELAIDGVIDASDVLALARPRGLFGNPNLSALMVNIIALFLQIVLRNRLLTVPKPLPGVAAVIGPILVSGAVASRAEFGVAVVLAILNFSSMMRNWDRPARVRAVFGVLAIPIGGLVAIGMIGTSDATIGNITRVLEVVQILDKSAIPARNAQDNLDSVARPLLLLNTAIDRFSFSPLFGSGFSSAPHSPFDLETLYFHNDWFRLVVTSGIIGVVLMLYLIWRFCYPLGWPIVIPFFLPGLVNTFQLSIPAFLFYMFMVGAVRERLAGNPR